MKLWLQREEFSTMTKQSSAPSMDWYHDDDFVKMRSTLVELKPSYVQMILRSTGDLISHRYYHISINDMIFVTKPT